jgi:hypothetical protein
MGFPTFALLAVLKAARQEGEVLKNTSGISREQWPVV